MIGALCTGDPATGSLTGAGIDAGQISIWLPISTTRSGGKRKYRVASSAVLVICMKMCSRQGRRSGWSEGISADHVALGQVTLPQHLR
jgi:hypothetical protein